MRYRGTYVIERIPDEGDPEVLFSASEELTAPTAADAHDPLLTKLSETINRLSPMLVNAEDDPEPLPAEVVPNAPTIKSVTHEKE